MFGRRTRGFTLIELLVVISIIGLLSSVVLASLGAARGRARIAAGQILSSSLYRTYGADAVVMYDFEEAGARDDAIDSGVSSANLILRSDAERVSDTPNRSAKSMSFNGAKGSYAISNKRITVGNSAADWTISAWVKPTIASVINNGIFLTPASPMYLRYITTTGFFVSWRAHYKCKGIPSPSPSSGVQCSMSENKPRPINTWYFVAVTHSGLNTVLYVDGKETMRDSTSDSWVSQTGDIVVGALNASTFFFTGYVDDVRIYNQSLVASDIQKMYAQGASNSSFAVKDLNDN